MLAQTYANQMSFNNTHIITIAKDWRDNGSQYWKLMHGQKIEEGYEICNGFTTRHDALVLALLIARAAKKDTPCGPLYPVIAYEHGFRKFRYVDNVDKLD